MNVYGKPEQASHDKVVLEWTLALHMPKAYEALSGE